ncbi:MAG TPA: UTP--glucose-1-phosphate uridylyltransferase, partial [Candidatus Glassbacteria bacterium]|nr:UTP--glucose-1-phosphate uridylyltransferase [Candidatus Glassbacteria bacterium]
MAITVAKADVLAYLPAEVKDAAGLVESAFANGQEHLFEDWESRSESYRRTRLQELRKIDWEVVEEAIEIITGRGETVELEEDEIKPMVMRTWKEQQPERAEEEEAGRQALIEGRVAWLIPAGGSGSRLVRVLQEIYDSLPFRRRYKVADAQMRQFDEACAKGQLPITPVLGKTLYGLFIEQALALGARVNRMPVLIFMLSDTTREASLTAITTHPLYSALEPAIVLFDHGMNPVLDDQGRIIAEDDRGRLAFSGNGNGGMFKGMWKTPFRGKDNVFAWLRAQGVEVVGFSNVDNPVSDIILPRMLGSHFRQGCKLTFGVVKKVDASERVGMIVRLEGRGYLDKIEYNVFPPALVDKRNPDDPERLLFEHGDVNVFLMDLGTMEKVRHLPLSIYRNKEVSTRWGKKKGNKFETFTFHIIQQVPAAVVDVKEILREEQFMPTKNSVGRDSPATVIRALCTRNLKWLEEQGATLARQTVEGCVEDYAALCRERLLSSAAGTDFEGEVKLFCDIVESMRAGRRKPDVDELFRRAGEIGARAEKAGQ